MNKTEEKFNLGLKIAELEKIEEYFQKPDLDLDEAILQHKKAIELSEEIKKYLDTVESSLKSIDIKNIK